MLLRTHLAIAVLITLLFLPSVSDKLIFSAIVILATFLPDIDTGFSTIGKTTGTGVVRFFVRHRGVVHSFSFCVLVSLVFALFIPIITLPFFLGYSLHLFTDSFTIDGIRPFWPTKHNSKGFLKTGSFVETFLFIALLIIDIVVFLLVMNKIF